MSREDGFRDHGLCGLCSAAPCMCLRMRGSQAPAVPIEPTFETDIHLLRTIVQAASVVWQREAGEYALARIELALGSLRDRT